MEQINFSEHSRTAHFGHRKLTPRACVVDSKKHLRLFLSDALEDLGFVTCECGQAGDLAGVLQSEQPDLIVLSVCVDGINVGEILEAIVRKNFGGKVLVIGQPDSIMVKAVRQIGEEYNIAMLPSSSFRRASSRSRSRRSSRRSVARRACASLPSTAGPRSRRRARRPRTPTSSWRRRGGSRISRTAAS